MIETFIQIHPVSTYLFLGVIFLCVGSFLNVLIYRLPFMLQAHWANDCHILLKLETTPLVPLTLFYPRSFCPACKKNIPWWHNIPLLSYLFLRGRCHHCHHSIPWHYPLVEVVCCMLSLLTLAHFGLHLMVIFPLLFVWGLIGLFVIDMQHQLLPDSLTLGLLWLGLFVNINAVFTPLPIAVLSAAGAYLALWLFIHLFYLLSGKVGMGHGDFKLFAAFGAWFGWTQLPFILICSSLTGALIVTFYLKITHQTKDTPIPFGPFLCLAGLLSLFFGSEILHWYFSTILIS